MEVFNFARIFYYLHVLNSSKIEPGKFWTTFCFFLSRRNSLGLYYPKSCQTPRRVSWIFQLKTFSNFKNSTGFKQAFPCKKPNPAPSFEIWLPNYKMKKKKRKIMASILLFREKFPREARKNDVAHPGLARFANFFSLDSHATIEERNFPSRGERAPRKFRQRRALAACTRVNVRMSRLDFLVSLSFAARLACPNATLVAFRLTILSTKLRPVRRGNGTKDGEVGARRRWKRGEQRIVPTGFTRSLWTGRRGDTSLVCEGERRGRREGVILPCVTRITRAALKSTRRTFYRGQS